MSAGNNLLDTNNILVIMLLIPAQVRGGSRDDPESERGAVPGIRVVTGFLDVDPDIWAGGQHRGGAPKGAINLSAPDGAPLPLLWGNGREEQRVARHPVSPGCGALAPRAI